MFGGTFDPPHIGHLVAALYSFEAISLDRLLFVVNNIPWQKVGSRPVTAAEDRFRMVEAAIAGHDGFEASRVELELGGTSSTVRTLTELRRRHPDSDLHLVLGADAAAGIPTWIDAGRLPGLCRLVVLERPGVTGEVPPGFVVDRVAMPLLSVSSTELRERLGAGLRVDWLVPEAVQAVITELGLYGSGGGRGA